MAIVQNPITAEPKRNLVLLYFQSSCEKTSCSKPMEVKNPQTSGQVTQRNKLATNVDLVRQVLPLLNKFIQAVSVKCLPSTRSPV